MPTEPQLLDEQALAEIEARAEAATEGPWEIQPSTLPPYSVGVICQYESHDCLFVPDSAGAMIDSVEMIANLTFASHARTDVPALCQTVRAAWARTNEALTQQRRELGAYYDELSDKFRRVQSAARVEIERLESENAALRNQLDELRRRNETQSESILEFQAEEKSLRARLAQVEKERQEARAAAFREMSAIIDTAGEEWGDQARARKSKTYSAYVIAALDLKGRLEAAANSVDEGKSQ